MSLIKPARDLPNELRDINFGIIRKTVPIRGDSPLCGDLICWGFLGIVCSSGLL